MIDPHIQNLRRKAALHPDDEGRRHQLRVAEALAGLARPFPSAQRMRAVALRLPRTKRWFWHVAWTFPAIRILSGLDALEPMPTEHASRGYYTGRCVRQAEYNNHLQEWRLGRTILFAALYGGVATSRERAR